MDIVRKKIDLGPYAALEKEKKKETTKETMTPFWLITSFSK